MIYLPLASVLYPPAYARPGEATGRRRGQSTSAKHFSPARHSPSVPCVEKKCRRGEARFCDTNRKGERGQRFPSAKCNIGSHNSSREKCTRQNTTQGRKIGVGTTHARSRRPASRRGVVVEPAAHSEAAFDFTRTRECRDPRGPSGEEVGPPGRPRLGRRAAFRRRRGATSSGRGRGNFDPPFLVCQNYNAKDHIMPIMTYDDRNHHMCIIYMMLRVEQICARQFFIALMWCVYVLLQGSTWTSPP